MSSRRRAIYEAYGPNGSNKGSKKVTAPFKVNVGKAMKAARATQSRLGPLPNNQLNSHPLEGPTSLSGMAPAGRVAFAAAALRGPNAARSEEVAKITQGIMGRATERAERQTAVSGLMRGVMGRVQERANGRAARQTENASLQKMEENMRKLAARPGPVTIPGPAPRPRTNANIIKRITELSSKSSFNPANKAEAARLLLAYNKSRPRRPQILNNKNVKILRKKINQQASLNIGSIIANTIKAATTPGAAKKFVQNTPPGAQRKAFVNARGNVPPAIAQAMNPNDLAKAIVAAIEAGVKKIPPKVVAPALAAPAAPASSKAVARVLDAKALAEAVVEAIRQGLNIRPEVIRQKPAEEIAPELQKAAPNTGKLAQNVARVIENAVRSAARPGAAPNSNKKSWRNWLPSFGAAAPRQATGGSFFNTFKLPKFGGGRSSGTRRRFRWPWERRIIGISGPYYVWTQGQWVPTPVGYPPPQPQPIPPNVQPPRGTTIYLNPNGTGGIAVPVTVAQATRAAANASASANAATQAANEPGAPPAARARANAAVQAANAANNAAEKAANAPNAAAAKKAANTAVKAAKAAATAAGGAGGSATGGTGGGASITFSPTIKIGLNKLPQAVQQARNNPNKMANLMRLVNNLKAKLPSNSKTQQTIQQLFREPNKLPTSTQMQTAFKRSYKNMNMNELLSLRATGKNRAMVNSHLREAVRTQVRRVSRLSGTERSTYMAELYRSLPKNFAGRAEVERELVKEVRGLGLRTSGGGYGGYGGGRSPYESRGILNGLRRNFGSSLPPRLRDEMRVQERRIMERQGPLRQNIGGRRGEYGLAAEGALRQRGVRTGNQRPLAAQGALRQTGFAAPGRNLLTQGLLKQGGAELNIGLGKPLAPLPSNQQSAINKAGGHQTALQTIAAVPGGAPQVALAAQALNETNGNRQLAVERGVAPAAINAVQKLGGSTNAGYVLEGLNTLAQTRKTQVRKAARKGKKKTQSLRLNELNNVINAVKKRKLISIVAHNVTHSGIHNNENRKKKYYKKVIKSSILRRPLANKVRAAAKKTSNVNAKARAKKR